MKQVEVALQTWKQQKLKYQKTIGTILTELSKPLSLIPSPEYQSRFEELQEYLRYNYTYDDEDSFIQIFVHIVEGKKNISLMELANHCVSEIGGDVKFWQNKIIDIANYVNYHSELSIWETYRAYDKFMGLPPEKTANLRKKRTLAKQYLACLSAITKAIDKAKPEQSQLVKIDELFKKMKKNEQKYYAFLEQTEQNNRFLCQHSNISTKGKNNAKSNLFMFLKPKEEKKNTLINYNFKNIKQLQAKPQKLLRGQAYNDLQQILQYLHKQQAGDVNENRNNNLSGSSISNPLDVDQVSQKNEVKPIQKLKQQFQEDIKKQIKIKDENIDNQNTDTITSRTFICCKDYYFTYWGFPIDPKIKVNYLDPLKKFEVINYEVDSADEYDQLLAEDLEDIDDPSQESNSQNENSFVVSDGHLSDNEGENGVVFNISNYYQDRWSKIGSQIEERNIVPLYHLNLPLSLQEGGEVLPEQFKQKIHGKGRNQIFELIDKQNITISKNKLFNYLRNNYKKVKKNQRVIYMKIETESKDKQFDKTDEETVIENEEQSNSITFSQGTRRSSRIRNKIRLQTSYEVDSQDQNQI